ncbi:protein DpdE [Microvirga alba]|uniref:Helicase ATP-binding domain-containing protein n=1 Tax=Microvirga alba TaxID=2791025 RepID=A0A931FPT6_9HYPH|nr:protein DpdE [Microvirga alba]MBF9235115.1 hypothetical protein [Microvirga alba]
MADAEYAFLREGWFVEVDDVRRLGKFIARDGARLDVEFFHSASNREVVGFEASVVRRTYLARETRVYFSPSESGQWLMGRIRGYFLEDDGSVTYEVRCPNGHDRDVPESALRARCFAVLGDPAEVLAIGAGETQRWHDARWSALESLIALRSASNGLTGLASASVELVPHQVEAIRRVLCDPLQRYLLADEVGLGKTIEAAAIIRQVLLDEPGRRAVVAVTQPLLKQWERELHDKFGIEVGGEVRLVAHDELSNCKSAPDLLVIDEAHRIVPGSPTFDALSRLSQKCRRTLLLSATPLIGHEEAFLALLRWLDPDRWKPETLEGFRHHVAKSQEYGRLLLGLRADASTFLLRQRATGAKHAFPDDATVQELANELLEKLDIPDQRSRLCGELREHIADTYRIHHRIVRSRRSDLDGWEFQPRGPATVREEADDDPALQKVVALLEDWRGAALLALDADPGLEDVLARRFALLVETAGQGVGALATLPQLEPLFASESEFLVALRSCAEPDAIERRAEQIALIAERHLKFLRQSITSPKLVVFATNGSSAAAIATALHARLAAEAVITLARAKEGDDVVRFECDPRALVAILDVRGEEGLNLHFADAVLHTDLPLSIGRLEQRIGRLDRFGRSKGPLKHIVVIPDGDENTPWSVWLDLLRSGIEIFDRPVSDLQFVIEGVERGIRRHLLRSGANNLDGYISSLKELMATERQRLDEQYALDQLAMSREPSRALVAAMEEAEEDESELADRLEHLLGNLLNFRISRTKDEFRLAWAHNTLLPERPWRSVFEAALKRPLTWKRRVALARPDVGLLRPGAPLVDALERLLLWDDRGSAFATWRFHRGAGGVGDEGLYFRLCWVVSPGYFVNADLLKMEDVEGLRRRTVSFLRPWTLVQHVGADLTEVRAPEILQALQMPFRPGVSDGGRDFNLGSRPDWLASVVSPSEFADLCSRIRNFGRQVLEESEEFAARCKAAALAAKHDAERRRGRLESRAARGDQSACRERELDLAVVRSVETPSVRLDSVGAFILAGYVPQGARR